jgi:hypothetical protein
MPKAGAMPDLPLEELSFAHDCQKSWILVGNWSSASRFSHAVPLPEAEQRLTIAVSASVAVAGTLS